VVTPPTKAPPRATFDFEVGGRPSAQPEATTAVVASPRTRVTLPGSSRQARRNRAATLAKQATNARGDEVLARAMDSRRAMSTVLASAERERIYRRHTPRRGKASIAFPCLALFQIPKTFITLFGFFKVQTFLSTFPSGRSNARRDH